jgi:hypothetical protein
MPPPNGLDPLRADGRPERFLGLSHQQGVALALIAVALVWAAHDRGRVRLAAPPAVPAA